MARRLTKELADMQKAPLDWATCGPKDDDILCWTAMLVGPEGSPYAGGVFNLELTFPSEYPFKSPKVKFNTRIYHPNIKTDTGDICTDVLHDNWGPTLNVRYVLNALKQLLQEPHAENPLEPDIAKLLQEDRAEFNKQAAKYTADFAS